MKKSWIIYMMGQRRGAQTQLLQHNMHVISTSAGNQSQTLCVVAPRAGCGTKQTQLSAYFLVWLRYNLLLQK
jgi:hypothetical protein